MARRLAVCVGTVHLRVREVDQLVPKSLYPTTSGNTYWQVETESSLMNGLYSLYRQRAAPSPLLSIQSCILHPVLR